MPTKTRRRRVGGSAAKRHAVATRKVPMLPQLTRNLPCVEPLDQAQIERIDHESMRILEEVGVDYRDPIALEQWRQAGARIDGQRVYADRGLIKELIKTIPKKLTLHARDPEKTVKLGGPNSIFVPMTGAPYMRDLNGVRRNPGIADLGTFHKLSHMLPAIHSSAWARSCPLSR